MRMSEFSFYLLFELSSLKDFSIVRASHSKPIAPIVEKERARMHFSPVLSNPLVIIILGGDVSHQRPPRWVVPHCRPECACSIPVS